MTFEITKYIWVICISLFYKISSKNYILNVGDHERMFGRGKIKAGDHVFVVQKDQLTNTIIIGKVQSVDGDRIRVNGTVIKPVGLLERVKAGRAIGRPKEVLENPDPNNCIFMLIESGGDRNIQSRGESKFFQNHLDKRKAVFCP